MKTFDEMIEHVIKIEGGYVNDPNDSGGETNWGITKKTALSAGYVGSMKSMTKDQARQIYKVLYWDTARLDEIVQISSDIAYEMLDTGINMGVGRGVFFLQRALNALNRQQKDFSDITADGVIGPKTISSLKSFLSKRGKQGEVVLLRALNCLQCNFYIELCEKREKDEEFLFGWILNRVSI